MTMKCGLEIHQQLSTKKLFCECPSELSDKVMGTVTRILRPTQSEMGEVDRAAMEESLKHRRFIYEITDNSCLVELDEEPPHDLNREALEVALKVALMFNAKIVDEIHVMRKIVIDGSNTSGFQRTALIAVDGYMDTSFGRVRIPTICLEEEAARKIEEREGVVVYRLDRLGIPLIEISTDPDMHTGEEVKEAAQRIGYILRATKKVRRGAGTIRQDINVSTGQGRVEIKGASRLNMIPKWVNMELERQEMLKKAAETLRDRNAKIDETIYDITEIFKNTESKIIARILKKGGKVLAIKLNGFAGLLKSGKFRLGREFADRVRVIGIRGLFHSDELPAYGVSEDEVKRVKDALNAGEYDAFVLIAEREELARLGLEKVIERAKIAMNGVPGETRAPKDDGSTAYLRPLPGAERMYPETDIPPIRITEEYIEELRKSLPKMPEERVAELVDMGISEQEAWQIVHMGMDDEFENIVKKYGYPTIVARAMLNGCEDIDYEKIFEYLSAGKFAKEAVDDIVLRACNGEDVEKVMKEYEASIDLDAIIDRIIEEKKELINERGMGAFKPLMGLVMKEVRGKVDGKKVSEVLRSKLKDAL
ncbi:MAG: Glu-tRNA(Gln) amidotransferase subunit GatE [Euryarchaeota archaeon]|nr:Glu-tRNA(Gln) amidotransferase subunit GatE [Euryarchaeota archaeon]